MLSYLFECQKCGVEYRELRAIEHRNEPSVCPNCEGEGKRQMGPKFTTDIMSDRWTKNRNEVMKQEQKCLKEHGTYK
jgi:putative FmdB family regulatory protein